MIRCITGSNTTIMAVCHHFLAGCTQFAQPIDFISYLGCVSEPPIPLYGFSHFGVGTHAAKGGVR